MPALVSYLGNENLKRSLLEQIAIHEQADQIVKGTYGRMNGLWRGCAIGCSLRSLNIVNGHANINRNTSLHDRFPAELGIPMSLAYMEDHIFENLPDELSPTWPRRFADAVPVGADLSGVTPRLMLWILVGDPYGVIHVTANRRSQLAIDRVADLFTRDIAGEHIAEAEWISASQQAGRVEAEAWAAWAARMAEAAEAGVAWAAEEAAEAWAAWVAFYPALSEHLLDLLRDAPAATVAA